MRTTDVKWSPILIRLEPRGMRAAVALCQLCCGTRFPRQPKGNYSAPLRVELPRDLGSRSQGECIPRFWGVKLTDPPKLRWQRGIEPAADGDHAKPGRGGRPSRARGWAVYSGRRSFYFAGLGLFSFGLAALSVYSPLAPAATPRRAWRGLDCVRISVFQRRFQKPPQRTQ